MLAGRWHERDRGLEVRFAGGTAERAQSRRADDQNCQRGGNRSACIPAERGARVEEQVAVQLSDEGQARLVGDGAGWGDGERPEAQVEQDPE